MDKAPEAFRTISEVAEWLGVQPHVLRFWESKFPQIKPVKRAGGRRYYRPSDMRLLGGLKKLLHEDGLTIKGAQKVLREQGVHAVQGMAPQIDEDTFETAPQEGDPQAAGQAAGTLPPESAPQPVIAADAPELSVPNAAIPTPPKKSFADVLEETDGDAAPEPDPSPEDLQGRLDLPLVRRRARPVDEKAAPAAPEPAAPRPPKSERAARTPPPATLFDDLAAASDTPADPPSEAPAGEGTAPPEPAKQPEFRSRLGGMVATEAVAQGNAGAPAEEPAPSTAPISLPPAETPLDAALSMLQPGDVPAIRLRPIFDQLVALRARMDAAG